ncbi:hypothetical protein BDV96DRAFT_640931 [Lophiotrema nucula]|uniref:Uncharacterized protein n=1 Tax=Lophiotrema nucula TaxID=690887 RepID=A0A6A5ZPE6_9PLEO|nr:hypothetical protein BDV96DRAFT_640931 [Lophiotrema nucula]
MAKRKAETVAIGRPKRLKTSTQTAAPRGKNSTPQPDVSKPAATGADKPDKKFNNWLKQMKKRHRKQVHKARDGQQVVLQWNDKRKEVIEKLRGKGLLKADEEGDFSWPADIPSSKYDGSANPAKASSETEDEDTLVAKTGNGERVASSNALEFGHDSADELAVQVLPKDKKVDETPAGEHGRVLWSGNVVARLADITGGENTRPELVLKLNIQICQEPAQTD